MSNEDIEAAIKAALPTLNPELMPPLLVQLQKYGVETTADLDPDFLQEKDLVDFLPLIQVRKLRRYWKEQKENQTPQAESARSVIESTSPLCPGVDFNKLSHISLLEKPNKISPKIKRRVTNELCDQIMLSMNGKNPGRKCWRDIAASMAAKFPIHFREEDLDGGVIGTGSDGLMTALEQRCENERRCQTKRKLKLSEDVDDPQPADAKKKSKADSYGCVEWSVASLPDGCSKETEEEKRQLLEEQFNGDPNAYNIGEIIEKMNDLYGTLREEINVQPSSELIIQRWPYLFLPKVFFEHFKRLTSVNAFERVATFTSNKAAGAIKFFVTCGKQTKECFVMELACSKAKTELGNSKSDILALIHMVALNFGEDFSEFIQEVEETATPTDVEREPINTPHLVALGRSLYTAKTFYLVVDRRVCATALDPVIAVAMLFSSYYVFNILYPVKLTSTMEFIQRCIMKINPPLGSSSKSAKKKGNPKDSTNKKVIDLIANIRDFVQLLL